MVDRLHIHIWNWTMKPLAIVLRGAGKGLGMGRWWGDLTNVLCKPIQNCHSESPRYHECILIKMKKKKRRSWGIWINPELQIHGFRCPELPNTFCLSYYSCNHTMVLRDYSQVPWALWGQLACGWLCRAGILRHQLFLRLHLNIAVVWSYLQHINPQGSIRQSPIVNSL
jgi:hypothetical protein